MSKFIRIAKYVFVIIVPLFVYYIYLFFFQFASVFFPPFYFLQIGFLVIFSLLNLGQIKICFRNKPIFASFLIVMFFFITLISFNNSFKGKIGFVFTTNNPHEYSDQHWYFLNRVSDIYPFDSTGLAYINKKKGLTLPDGYTTTQPIQNDGWYSIITNRFYVWAIIQSILGGLFCTTFAAKRVNRIDDK